MEIKSSHLDRNSLRLSLSPSHVFDIFMIFHVIMRFNQILRDFAGEAKKR